MILTNEQVAELLERKRVPTLYRVHEQPDPERIERLVEQLAALDVPTPPLPKQISPSQAGELAAEASRLVAAEAERRGHGREAYTSLVLRSLKQAHYSDRNLGHAGLGSPAYCHFTSPIRRYPDLIAHRALLSAIGEGEEAPRAERLARGRRRTAPSASATSTRIERDADDVCAAFLLERELFERGPGRPLRGRGLGRDRRRRLRPLRRRAGDVYEGFLPARRIGGRERYELDETETMLVGARGGRRGPLRRPGDASRVDRVEAPRGRVDLLPRGRQLMAKKAKKQRKPGSGRRRDQPPRPAQVRAAREDGGRDRAAGQRGQVAARGQGADQRGLRGGRRRRGLAARRPHPALPAGLAAEPRSRPAAQAAPPPARDRAPDRQDRREGADPDPDPDLLQGPAGEGRAGAREGQGGPRPPPRDRRPRPAARGRAGLQAALRAEAGLRPMGGQTQCARTEVPVQRLCPPMLVASTPAPSPTSSRITRARPTRSPARSSCC